MNSNYIFIVLLFSIPFSTCDDCSTDDPDRILDKCEIKLDPVEASKKCGEGPLINRTCVEYTRCGPDGFLIPEDDLYGGGSIEVRLGDENGCGNILEVCCKHRDSTNVVPDVTVTTTTVATTTTQREPPSWDKFACGKRNPEGLKFKVTGQRDNEAQFGEFPWMVAILKRHFTAKDQVEICGGSLIHPKVVLTAAHCVNRLMAGDIKIRAGEWDTQTTIEPYPYQERNVVQIILHERYNAFNLLNDIALLILDQSVNKEDHIGTVCLPEQDEARDKFHHSKNCVVTGWGKDIFDKKGVFSAILKSVKLPMVYPSDCELLLVKNTNLPRHFRLHDSFLCAGGEEGKDACKGDGGAPLVCPDSKNPKRYVQTGIVSWGKGCGKKGVPGVYGDVSRFRKWIDDYLKRLSIL